MKGSKQKKKLKARQDGWENMRFDNKSEKKGFINKSCFTKPGSNTK